MHQGVGNGRCLHVVVVHGKLALVGVAAHHAFWRYPRQTRTQCTITELIYVPESIPDGLYLLNLQTASLMVDVSPSKPVLYALSAIG